MTQQALTDPAAIWVEAGPNTTCATCGVVFWMTQQMYDKRHDDHRNFYCPNGHVLVFNAESEAERLKRELKVARDNGARLVAERDQAEASRRAWKGQTTRLKNLAAAGSCPFCGQHLRDLARHIGRQHPDEPTEPVE